jgi:hypothetical protein
MLLHSRVMMDNDSILCISKKLEERIMNVFTTKKCLKDGCVYSVLNITQSIHVLTHLIVSHKYVQFLCQF